MNLKKFNEKRGITLIALVVTIIVLLILAGISISMLTGQNGVLNRAKGAKEEYSNSTEKEQVQLSYNSAITRKLGESITAEELQNELNEVVGKNEDGTSKAEVTDKENGVFNVKFIKTNHNYRVDNGDVTLLAEEEQAVVEPKNIADWEYTPNDDGTLTITVYKGSDTEVVFPNYINGVKVKRIESSNVDSIWDNDISDENSRLQVGYRDYISRQKTIKKVTISYGIEEIGEYAFCATEGLENISIPSSVTSIKSNAFNSCMSLTDITIPSSIKSIGYRAFCGSCLTDITIPSSVTSIEAEAFLECGRLTSITIPSSVTSIGYGAFFGCSGLTSITIPSRVTSIGDDAFGGCSSLTNVTIPSSVTSIGHSAFGGCSSLTSITIPSSVTSIGYSAFFGCSGLTSITIPSSMTNIGNLAFWDCSNLTNITIPSNVTSMGSEIFKGIPSITVTVPYKSGENPPSGWDSEWNSTDSGCEIKIKYQQ